MKYMKESKRLLSYDSLQFYILLSSRPCYILYMINCCLSCIHVPNYVNCLLNSVVFNMAVAKTD